MLRIVRKSAKKKRKPLTAAQIQRREQKAHAKAFLVLFQKLGFAYIATDGVQVTYEGRNGEFDAIFVHQNILLVVEYTIGKPDSAHLLKKKVLYDLILADVEKFLAYAETIYPKLKDALDPLYPRSVFKAKILYASKRDPSDELINACPNVHFVRAD